MRRESSQVFIKKLLVDEFGDTIGFHNRFEKNESTLVYDSQQGEAAINSWGISLEQLLQNTAARINREVRNLPHIP